MSFSDETLMAFADGELDSKTRAAIEAAMASDAAIARRVAQHLALRNDVFAAFAPILDETVPQRLSNASKDVKKPPMVAPVIELAAVRAARMPPPVPPAQRRWSWPEWGALAATLIVGVLAGHVGLPTLLGEKDGASDAALTSANGKLIAKGPLAQALSSQLASAQPANATVKIGVSFRSKDGQFCRSFVMHGGLSGLACHRASDNAWQLPLVAQTTAAQSATYRQAGADIPSAVLQAIDERIEGPSLDVAGESQAIARRWRP